MNLFIIPGNPPALYFYELWKQEILHKFPHAQIKISPYTSHAPNLSSECYLDKTLSHHESHLRDFQKSTNGPITVIGHSIGAYVALGLLKRQPLLISQVHILFPFLQAPSLLGKFILTLARALTKLSWIIKGILLFKKVFGNFHPDLKHISDSELQSGLALAYHEWKIPAQLSIHPSLSDDDKKKLHFIYCPNDTWCTKACISSLITLVSHTESDASHSFIIRSHERLQVLSQMKL